MFKKERTENKMWGEPVSTKDADVESAPVFSHIEVPSAADRHEDTEKHSGSLSDGIDPEFIRVITKSLQNRSATEVSISREKKIANYAFWTSLIGNWVSAIFFNTVLSPIFLFIAGAAWGYKSGLSSQNESLLIGAKKAAFDGAQLVIFNLILGLIFSVGIGFSIPAIVGLFIALGALPYFLGWVIGGVRGNHLQKRAIRR